MSSPAASKTCKACKESLPIDAFETYKARDGTPKTRLECKLCRSDKRKQKVQAAPKKDPADYDLPEACVECGLGPDEVKFKFRTDTQTGGYRPVCNSCYNARGYADKCRKRMKEEDAEGFNARNAAAQKKFRDSKK